MFYTTDEAALAHYFGFIHHRMEMFWQRSDVNDRWQSEKIANSSKSSPHNNNDQLIREVLLKNRFTNVYRALDRVSQYLIREVIYKPTTPYANAADATLNIIIFRLFNRIDVWQLVQQHIGHFQCDNFQAPSQLISSQLTDKIEQNQRVWNSAYIMPSVPRYPARYKHESWLTCLRVELLEGKLLDKILGCTSLRELFNTLLAISGIGPFLAMQIAIDLNYSEHYQLDENEFIHAGPGAQRGISACFPEVRKNEMAGAIEHTMKCFDAYSDHFGYNSALLRDRKPTLIDLQNCFCETDKVLRVCMSSKYKARARIKQRYNSTRINPATIDYFFPPKWNIKL